jgi:hypothetical protein
MKKQFIRLTSGWIPVSVLILFAIALVAGQARANLPDEITAAPVLPVATTSVNSALSINSLKKLDALPLAIDTFLALPSELSVRMDNRVATPRRADDGTPRLNSN